MNTNLKTCSSCATEIQLQARKCPHCLSRQPGTGLYRSRDSRMLAGVCGALARELGVDVTFVRVAFALTAVISFGLGFWAYVALWVLTPASPGGTAPLARLMERIRNIFTPAAQQSLSHVDNN